jgi:hypothetical protein
MGRDRKQSLLLGSLIFFGYIFIPRGGVDFLSAFIAMLGALGARELISHWGGISSVEEGAERNAPHLEAKPSIMLLFLVIYTLLGAFTYRYVGGKTDLYLKQDEREAMEWIRDNTPINSKVAVFPPFQENRYWWNDYRAEWMPVISDRECLTTVQGYEWLPDVFSSRIEAYTSLRSCGGADIDCLISWIEDDGFEMEYYYVPEKDRHSAMIKDLVDSPRFVMVFENRNNAVFEFKE